MKPGGLRLWRILPIWVATLAVAGVSLHFSKRPSLERDWQDYARRLPSAEIDGDRVTVRDMLDLRWEAKGEIAEYRYLVRSFDLGELETVWFLKEDFSENPIFAHTFLSFGFGDGDFLSVSIEARKKRGEDYSGWRGLWRNYELMIVAGAERDFIGRRSHVHRAPTYCYPVQITPEGARALLLTLLEEMNRLQVEPAFYNTLTSNCTNNLFRAARRATGVRIPLRLETLLPGYTDRAAYAMGIIPTDAPFAEIQARYRVDPDAVSLDDPAFSEKIRRFGTSGADAFEHFEVATEESDDPPADIDCHDGDDRDGK